MSHAKDLGKNLYRLRKSKGLTQEKAAEQCDTSTRHFQDLEKGIVNPHLDELFKLAEGMQVDMNTLTQPSAPE